MDQRQAVKGHNTAVKGRKQNYILYLDSLQYTNKELKELQRVISSYGKQDGVREIRLQDNQLDSLSVPYLIELLGLCPYLSRLDLKKNCLDDNSVGEIQAYIERIPGVTSVQRDPATGDLTAKSGAQLRLV